MLRLSHLVISISLEQPPSSSLKDNNIPRSRWRSFLQILGRVTLVTLVTTGGVFYYITQKDRHPGEQLPHDPNKKTLVILGSGWGATSLLKSLDTENFNVIVISPKNFFLFTPLLPSVAVGTLASRSIIQPTRFLTRHKTRRVSVIEAEAESVDPHAKTVTFTDTSAIKGEVATKTLPYDYLVYAVGAETQTFNIPGVKEHAVFMKELADAEKVRSLPGANRQLCIETAAFPGQTEEEIKRLLHVVVVGGGPTGIELSGEFHDFLQEDLRSWYPELVPYMRITLIEALPSVLPMFSKELISYTESTFKEEKIEILTKTMVKEVKDKTVVVQRPDGTLDELAYGTLVWAGGNKGRKITTDLMATLGEHQTNRRGLTVDDHLILNGSDGSIFALGDCTSTAYAPTAQVASQQGAYLGRVFNKLGARDQLRAEADALRMGSTVGKDVDTEHTKLEKKMQQLSKLRPFHYSHQGSLAYIGSDKAIADLNVWQRQFASGGVLTYIFWRSAYLSTLFSLRNRTLVATDWLKVKLFGSYVPFVGM
ncbi:FAD/NAD-binding domain-containing protein [Ramaria rubella]|nr:FAD/NAD-binding domain-containing protein [Ramaria rubella]